MASISSIKQILGRTLVNNEGEKFSTTKDLAPDIWLLYYGADFCKPCHNLHEKLEPINRKWIARGYAVQVVYISSDSTEEEFDEYFGQQSWLAVPFENTKRRKMLKENFQVHSIPRLIVLDRNGGLITEKGRDDVEKYGSKSVLHWMRHWMRSTN